VCKSKTRSGQIKGDRSSVHGWRTRPGALFLHLTRFIESVVRAIGKQFAFRIVIAYIPGGLMPYKKLRFRLKLPRLGLMY
jgi:hypothetical protein